CVAAPKNVLDKTRRLIEVQVGAEVYVGEPAQRFDPLAHMFAPRFVDEVLDRTEIIGRSRRRQTGLVGHGAVGKGARAAVGEYFGSGSQQCVPALPAASLRELSTIDHEHLGSGG